MLSEHRGLVIAAVVLVLLVIGVLGAKKVADRSATSDTRARADQIAKVLDGATTKDFLAFNAGVRTPGSIAQKTRDQPDFVNVKATADLSFIRFQPDGWWSGFTERCIVARVTSTGVHISIPKTACVRIDVPPTGSGP